MSHPDSVHADLTREADNLDRVLARLNEDQWATPTPAPGWTVAHQVAHLAATFRLAGLAAADPPAFIALTSHLSDDFDANVAGAMAPFLAAPSEGLLQQWRAQRAAAIGALAAVPADTTVPWLVNPLPPHVLAAAGLMELFAHGQDILDGLEVPRHSFGGLRHLVAFIVRTRDFGYLAHGRTPPADEFRFEITGPDGDLWTYGPADSGQRISGPALDLCLLAARRRHRDDLALRASGAEAATWLEIAQAYRGPAGPGRAPGRRESVASAADR